MNVDFILYSKFENRRSSLRHEKIFAAILSTLNDEEINPISIFSEHNILLEKTLIYSFHPIADPVYFDFENNVLKATINTGSLGAGYHAFIVNILDRVSKRLNITWTEDESYPDKTLYFKTRDFGVLSDFFGLALSNYSKDLMTHYEKGFSNFMLSMPYDYPIVEKEFFALSPLGYWGKSFFMDVINATNDEKEVFINEFFIWESNKVNANFWFKSALSMIWLHFPFRETIEQSEDDLCRKILYSFEKAYELDTTLSYPWDIWILIANYILEETAVEEIVKRKPEKITSYGKIGFRLENGRFDLTAGFSIVMPMRMNKYRNNKTLIEFKDKDLYVALESYSFEEEDNEAIMEYIINQVQDIKDKKTKELDIKIDNKDIRVVLYEKLLDTNDYMLLSAVATSKYALILWFTYSDEKMKEKCVSYIKSITVAK